MVCSCNNQVRGDRLVRLARRARRIVKMCSSIPERLLHAADGVKGTALVVVVGPAWLLPAGPGRVCSMSVAYRFLRGLLPKDHGRPLFRLPARFLPANSFKIMLKIERGVLRGDGLDVCAPSFAKSLAAGIRRTI